MTQKMVSLPEWFQETCRLSSRLSTDRRSIHANWKDATPVEHALADWLENRGYHVCHGHSWWVEGAFGNIVREDLDNSYKDVRMDALCRAVQAVYKESKRGPDATNRPVWYRE